jgi:PTS system N-acetylglucosamine-specific IIC component
MASSGEFGLFVFGFFNRILLVTGLHHVLDSLFWFQLGDFTNAQGVVVHGDIARFMAGDPTAGYFQAGFFPIMMFGLPAICCAMYTTAYPQNRKAVGGLLLSMALTSFLTGVTEPIEYSFVFLAPILYLIHAILTGVSMALMEVFHIRLGFSFSSGVIDYILFFKISHNPLLMLPIGVATFIVYYCLGVFFIKKFGLATIGRESAEELAQTATLELSVDSRELQFIQALGGNANLRNVDACTTRLRLTVGDSTKINRQLLKALGAKGVVVPSQETVQVILGPQAEIIASAIREILIAGTSSAQAAVSLEVEPCVVKATHETSSQPNLQVAAAILDALGGKTNLIRLNVVALTRVKIELHNEQLIQVEQLYANQVIAIVPLGKSSLQLYLGAGANAIANSLQQLIL